MQNARLVRTDRKEEEERFGGGGVAGYSLETECVRLDAVSPLGVTAALSRVCVARRVAIDRRNSLSSGGNAKAP